MKYKYEITKVFEGVDLAHRVDSQQLDCNFTEGGTKELKCRRFHGHGAAIVVTLSSTKLVNNMVLDYNEQGFIKDLIKTHLDHHTLLNINDPIVEHIVYDPFKKLTGTDINLVKNPAISGNIVVESPNGSREEIVEMIASTIDLSNTPQFDSGCDDDIGAWFRGITFVNFATTSENIAAWLYAIVDKRVRQYNFTHDTDIKVVRVGYQETPTSTATYGI
jgi:6-pyruvoyl-tetrahydropterin synthase